MKGSFLLLFCWPIMALGFAYEKEDSDYDDYNDSEPSPVGRVGESVVMATPQFTTAPLSLLVNEGEVIRLPCGVDRLEGFVMLWKKGQNIITVGKQIIDKRVRLEFSEAGSMLVLGPASPTDQAEYTCQISAYKPTEITHSVKIRVRPVISVTPEKLVVTEGDSAAFSCSVQKGSPAPQIQWRRRDHTMPNGQETVQGNSITFSKVTRHHSGHYICEADNGFSTKPESREVRLDVHHSPHVAPLTSELMSGPGREEKLLCTVHSSPKAVVTWTRNDRVIDSNTKGLVILSQGPHHSLTLVVDESSTGLYACRASNDYGEDAKTIQVSGLARPPVFTSSRQSPYRDSYTLTWSVSSHSPVSSFKVSYREAGKQPWTTMEVVSSPSSTNSSSTSWLGSALLSHLKEATQYQARIGSGNQFGFSKPQTVFNFATQGAVPFHQPSISSCPSLPSHSLLISLLITLVVKHV